MSARTTADARLAERIAALGHSFEGEIKVGGHYASVVRDGDHLWLSGQIPRVQDRVVVTGAVGGETSLTEAQDGARICALRALVLLQRELGSLERVTAVPRITVFVQSAPAFTQQSEVADAASDLIFAVLGEAGRHTRSSIGVLQLPKNAAVEIDLVATAPLPSNDRSALP